MFEPIGSGSSPDGGPHGGIGAIGPGRAPEPDTKTVAATPVNAQDLIALREALAGMIPAATLDPAGLPTNAIASPDGPEAEAIDRITVLEALKAACAAAQARETAALHTHRIRAEADRGVPEARRGRGLPAEIALARKTGNARGSHHLRLAVNLTNDLPNTLAALTTGAITEDQAAAVDRQTHWLEPRQRRHVDTVLAGRLGILGNRELVREAQAQAQGQDPAAAVEHQQQACRDRHVSLKPAETNPGMAYLTALLPMAQAAACYRNLTESAASAVALGEAGERTPQQVLTDLFVERLTGQNAADTVPVEIQLVMTDKTLFGGTRNAEPGNPNPTAGTDADSDAAAATNIPAWIPGHGAIPAPTARQIIAGTDAEVFLRRLYTAPETGELVAMDSQRRTFTGPLRQMILIHDDICRTPYCDAPIRHVDHATPHRDGGATSYANGSGLCVRCNHTKEHPGWTHHAAPDQLQVTTPTGHHYTSQPRPLTPAEPPEATASEEPASPGASPEDVVQGLAGEASDPSPSRIPVRPQSALEALVTPDVLDDLTSFPPDAYDFRPAVSAIVFYERAA